MQRYGFKIRLRKYRLYKASRGAGDNIGPHAGSTSHLKRGDNSMRFIAVIQEEADDMEFGTTLLLTADSMDTARELLDATAANWWYSDDDNDNGATNDGNGTYCFGNGCKVWAGDCTIISEGTYLELKSSHLTEFVQHPKREA
jgi:hypothetical protein